MGKEEDRPKHQQARHNQHKHQLPETYALMTKALVLETKLVAKKLGYVPRQGLASVKVPVALPQISLSRKAAASVSQMKEMTSLFAIKQVCLLNIDFLLSCVSCTPGQEHQLVKKQQGSSLQVVVWLTIPVPALVECRSDRIPAT